MTTIAIASPIVLMLYLILNDWVDLRMWNAREPLPTRQKLMVCAANYVPLLFIAFAFSTGSIFLMLVAATFALIEFAMHIAYWWVPYLFGTSEQELEEHEQLFGNTVRILPRIGNHPVPNAEHTVAGLLMVVMVVSALWTTVGLVAV